MSPLKCFKYFLKIFLLTGPFQLSARPCFEIGLQNSQLSISNTNSDRDYYPMEAGRRFQPPASQGLNALLGGHYFKIRHKTGAEYFGTVRSVNLNEKGDIVDIVMVDSTYIEHLYRQWQQWQNLNEWVTGRTDPGSIYYQEWGFNTADQKDFNSAFLQQVIQYRRFHADELDLESFSLIDLNSLENFLDPARASIQLREKLESLERDYFNEFLLQLKSQNRDVVRNAELWAAFFKEKLRTGAPIGPLEVKDSKHQIFGEVIGLHLSNNGGYRAIIKLSKRFEDKDIGEIQLVDLTKDLLKTRPPSP